MRQSIIILALLLLSATSGFGVYAAESPSLKRVRVIFGYENIGRWEQQFTETIAQIFLDDTRVIFQPNYLPLDAQDPASFALFSTLEQIRPEQADAVIAVRPLASVFVNRWRDTFFPDIPRLYVIPGSEIASDDLASDTDVIVPSGVESATRETLELVPQLLPNLEHIYILLGDSVVDASYLLRIQSVIQEAGLHQTIHYLIGLTPSEISAELNAAPQNSAAVFGLYSKDRTGQLFRTSDVVSLVSAQTDTPLFGLFDGARGGGIIGGSMTSATLYATKAAEQTLALLFDDEAPASLETPPSYVFDAIQLDRFGIDRDLLPEGSELLNANPSLLQQYSWLFILGAIIFVILVLFITALGQSLRRRNKAERIAYDTNEQLRRAQKMEAVGQLTGGIAHDFNNILAIIMGNLELIKLGVSGDKEILGDVNRALEGASRGTALIDKLLGFSRVQTNKTSPTSVNRLIKKMDDLLAKSLTVSIEFETQLDPKLWFVNVDAGDLEDAILNLALNARDAMPNGGRLIMETMNKVLDADFVRSQPEAEIGEYAMLSVRDTGVGMTAEVKEKALEPFFTTKAEGKGTGLGLSMVYGFVKRSGGFITLYSEPDAGTSINIFLPRSSKVERVKRIKQLPRGSETVLVVDDEEELAKLAVANLERLGYKTLTAFDGKSALTLIKDKPNIDLLFSDVVMPGGLDGYLLSIAAKQARPTLKILLASGFTKRKEADISPDDLMIEELTRNLLRKPYSQAELAKAVRSALDERPAIS